MKRNVFIFQGGSLPSIHSDHPSVVVIDQNGSIPAGASAADDSSGLLLSYLFDGLSRFGTDGGVSAASDWGDTYVIPPITDQRRRQPYNRPDHVVIEMPSSSIASSVTSRYGTPMSHLSIYPPSPC
jgi:hypothetical protein